MAASTKSAPPEAAADFHARRCEGVLTRPDRVAADLARCEVLSGAGQAELESLAGLLTPFAAPAGTVVLRRGEIADRFLLVTGGSARVVFGEEAAHKVAVVAEGPIVGEMALLRGTRVSATVSAQTDMRGLMGGQPSRGCSPSRACWTRS